MVQSLSPALHYLDVNAMVMVWATVQLARRAAAYWAPVRERESRSVAVPASHGQASAA